MTFCTDCNKAIDRRPRAEVEAAREVAKEVESASKRVQKTTSKLVQDPELTTAQAQAVIQSFATCANSLVAGKRDSPLMASELHECLVDCIDVVIEAESMVRGTVRGRDGTGGAVAPTAMVASVIRPRTLVPNLPVVDLHTTPHLYAIVDTACNTSVCGEGWLKRAANVWKEHGYSPLQVHRKRGPYGGIAGEASATMTGKTSWPLIVMAEGESPNDWAIPISISACTNQVEGNTNFLMGLDMQRQLRIRLDVVSNECTRELKDGSRREVQLAQAAGSGLPIIRIDDFERHDEFLESFGLPAIPDKFRQYCVAADSSMEEEPNEDEEYEVVDDVIEDDYLEAEISEDDAAFVGTGGAEVPPPRDIRNNPYADKKITVVTVGLEHLMDENESLADCVREQCKNDLNGFRVNYTPHRNILRGIFTEHYPRLAQKRLCFVECRDLRDPMEYGKKKKNDIMHMGTHPKILE